MNKASSRASNQEESPVRSDADLVAAVKAGSQEAFRELVERYREGVYRVAYRIVRDEEEARDVAQDAFIKAHRSLGGFAGRSSLFTWLYRITRNVALDHLRKRKPGRLVSLDAPVQEEGRNLADEIAAPAPSASDTAADEEMLARVRQALERLSEKHRIVLELREFEGKSYQEIADAVGCNVGTVMSRLFYARSQLAEWLQPYLDKEVER